MSWQCRRPPFSDSNNFQQPVLFSARRRLERRRRGQPLVVISVPSVAGMWSRWGQGLRTDTANSTVARAVDTQLNQSELVYTIGPNSAVAVRTVWRSHNVDVAHLVMVAAAPQDHASE